MRCFFALIPQSVQIARKIIEIEGNAMRLMGLRCTVHDPWELAYALENILLRRISQTAKIGLGQSRRAHIHIRESSKRLPLH